MRIRNSTIVLTGATGGIGSQLAAEFAGAGARMILVGRDHAQLDALIKALPVPASAPHMAVAVDLLEAAGRQKLRDLCAQQDIDLLVNNAGTNDFNLLENADPATVARQIELNLMVPVLLTQQLLPLLLRRPTGAVVNIGSAFGSIGYPGYAAYCASKFGLRGLSEVLRFDLARHRIGVSVVVPGAVNTPLVQTVDIVGVDRDHPKVQRLVRLFSGHAVSAEKVADKILAGVTRNRFLIYTSADIWALYMFKRIAWRPYGAVMSRVNVFFTGALRPHGAQYLPPGPANEWSQDE